MRFLLVLSMLFGCSGKTYPGDGRLVIVDIDQDLDWCVVTMTNAPRMTLGDAIRSGIRYWDEAGARLRTEDQLMPGEELHEKKAPHLRIRGDRCEDAGSAIVELGNASIVEAGVAQYNYDTGDIQLFVSKWMTRDVNGAGWLAIQSTIAHEAGHAIGLEHVPEVDAIMNADGAYARSDLADADLREYTRVWP